jgi:hypothetical protein
MVTTAAPRRGSVTFLLPIRFSFPVEGHPRTPIPAHFIPLDSSAGSWRRAAKNPGVRGKPLFT